jgi:transposase
MCLRSVWGAGAFVWPSTIPREGADRTATITPGSWDMLEGIDWRSPQQTWRPQAVAAGDGEEQPSEASRKRTTSSAVSTTGSLRGSRA